MKSTKKMCAAFQGEPGAFSHSAALKFLGAEIKTLPCTTFKSVFEALANENATHAVIPIENTLHGSVHENYDYLLEYSFWISGETSIRISHQLIALPGVSLSEIKRAFSHPVALNQCRSFFAKHKQIQPAPFYDTAGSVKFLKDQPSGSAAIASEQAAEIYGGVIIKRKIEDDRQNFTRFVLLTKQIPIPHKTSGICKTSIVFSTANAPGALFRAMACFALRDLSLTKIESRPLRGKPWEYLFYLDFLGSISEERVERALNQLQETAQFYKILGSYKPTP